MASSKFLYGCILKLGLGAVLLVSTTAGILGQTIHGVAEPESLQLQRAVRPWEFASAIGTRSALFGDESGNFEAWVYPLKILRNLHLRFKVDNEVIEAKSVARSIQVRPESTTITYSWDTFSVDETFLTPIDEPGAIIHIETNASVSIEVEAVFERDFQLEWPAAMGGSDIDWNPVLHAFYMDEVLHKFTALVGSPSARNSHVEFSTNYANAKENILSLGVNPPGHSSESIVIAASFQGLPPLEVTYKHLTSSYPQLLAQAHSYYQNYLSKQIQVKLPDQSLDKAYQWAQVSVLQGLVTNPYLGTGLVAGYKTSGEDDQRPGYAWFFGRDALWTSLALDAEGDYTTTRTALQFLTTYQRSDGKVPHEIAQGASFVPWFDRMPYAFAAADATPLLIVAMDDYVHRSGDVEFARTKWDNVWRAYQFILSTYTKSGFPRNEGIGHGWVEGGPLLPVQSELYQSSVALQALQSLADLAHLLGKDSQSANLASDYEARRVALNQAFWLVGQQRYAFALDGKEIPVDTLSALATVPMWFHLLDEEKAQSMVEQLADPAIQTDWGMRIIPSTSPKYDAAGYHSGTVWPLFTGWTSVGEYTYHAAEPAYQNLRSNALLTFDGSLGHVAEVLSGNYYQSLATGSPQQVWSSAMVISSLLSGLFGLDEDAMTNRISMSPHVPSDWTSFQIQNVRAGSCLLNFSYRKSVDAHSITTLTLDVDRIAGDICALDFSPALSLRTQVIAAELNGHAVTFHIRTNAIDQHADIPLILRKDEGPHVSLTLHLKDDFGLSSRSDLPRLGSTNQGLRMISETWNSDRDTLTLDTASAAGGTYRYQIWNPAQITEVEGAKLVRDAAPNLENLSPSELEISLLPGERGTEAHQRVVLHFAKQKPQKKTRLKGTHDGQ